MALRRRIAVRIGREAVLLLPAFTGVRSAADPVHRDRERFVGFLADRTERHRPRHKPFDDFFRGLNFLDGHRMIPLPQLHQSPERVELPVLPVDDLGILLVCCVVRTEDGVLQFRYRRRIDLVTFTVDPELIRAAEVELRTPRRRRAGGHDGASSPLREGGRRARRLRCGKRSR